MKFSPVRKPKQQITVIGNDEIGTIHLLKLGKITPAENPKDIQLEQIRLDTTNAVIEKASARLAEELKITRAAARKKLFAKSIKEAEGEDTNDQAVDAAPEFSLYDYLSNEEIAEMIRARENPMDTAIKVTTLFIKYRVAYPVVMTASLKGRSSELQAEPLLFDIDKDSTIRFTSGVVTTAEFTEQQSELVKISSDHGAIDAGIGYVCDAYGYRLGFADWSEQDTRENLTESLIAEIYRFYLVESEQVIDEPEGNEQTETTQTNSTSSNLNELPSENPSTGKKSTGSSNTTELATVA